MKSDQTTKSLFGKCLGMLLERAPDVLQVGKAERLYELARNKVLRANCEKDYIEAHQLIEYLLKLDSISTELRGLALIFSAMNYIDARGVKADPERALKNLIECDSIGYSDGAFNIGLFFDGRFGNIYPLAVNYNLAAFFYMRSVRMGSIPGLTNLALLHIGGHLSESNADLGWYFLKYAENRGDIIATEAVRKLSVNSQSQ